MSPASPAVSAGQPAPVVTRSRPAKLALGAGIDVGTFGLDTAAAPPPRFAAEVRTATGAHARGAESGAVRGSTRRSADTWDGLTSAPWNVAPPVADRDVAAAATAVGNTTAAANAATTALSTS